MYDLIGLVAPRPVLIEAGTYDSLFPLEAVKRSLEIARARVNAAFDAPHRIEADISEGRHQISGARAYDFLVEVLAATR